MDRTRRVALHRLTVLVVSTLLAAGCSGSEPEAEVVPDRGSRTTAEALDLLADDQDDDEGPTGRPQLLGVDAEAFVTPTPGIVLRFDETGEDDDAEGGDQDADDSNETAVVDTAGEPTPTPAPLPSPPPAAPGGEPAYPDSSERLTAAAGRPFPSASEVVEGDASTRGVTPSTITIGGLVSQTLAGAEHRSEACDGALARVGQANEHAELSRELVFSVCHDDAGLVDASSGLAANLVRSDVFAIAPLSTESFFGEAALAEAGVPHVGPDALPAYCGRATTFGFGVHGARDCPVLDARGYSVLSQPVLTAWSKLYPSRDAVPDRLVIAVEQTAGGQARGDQRRFEAELAELPTPDVALVLPSPASGPPVTWDSVVDQLLDGDPDVIMLDGDVVEGLPPALVAAGFDGEIVLVGRLDPQRVLDPEQRALLAPATVVSPGIDLASRDTPGWRAMAGAAASVGVDANDIGLDFVEGYLAVDFLIAALAATPEPLSAEAWHDTVNGGWWYPGIDGLACGSWWPAGHLIDTPCVSIARLDPDIGRLQPVLGLAQSEPRALFDLD